MRSRFWGSGLQRPCRSWEIRTEQVGAHFPVEVYTAALEGEARPHRRSKANLPSMLALCTCIAAAGFVPSTPPFVAPGARPIVAPATQRSGVASVQLILREERVESLKAGAISSVSGSVLAFPVKASALLVSNPQWAQWEFSTLALAVQLAMFGIVYRHAVRCDDNDSLRQGAVVAFAVVRAFSATHVKGNSFNPEMWLQLGAYFGEGILAFGGAAIALEFAWTKGWARRLFRLPPSYRIDRVDYNDIGPGFRDGFRDEPLSRSGGFRDDRPFY